MLSQLSVLSQTSLNSTIVAAVSDTTKDGRVFYNDLIFDDRHGEMFRTDKVGMDIIREINADRKRQKRFADSLYIENQLLINNFNDCDSLNSSLSKETDDLKEQLDIRQKMLDNEREIVRISDKQLKDLDNKNKLNKIGWSVAGITFGVAVVETLILILRK